MVLVVSFMQFDIISFCKGVFEHVTEYEQIMSHKLFSWAHRPGSCRLTGINVQRVCIRATQTQLL